MSLPECPYRAASIPTRSCHRRFLPCDPHTCPSSERRPLMSPPLPPVRPAHMSVKRTASAYVTAASSRATRTHVRQANGVRLCHRRFLPCDPHTCPSSERRPLMSPPLPPMQLAHVSIKRTPSAYVTAASSRATRTHVRQANGVRLSRVHAVCVDRNSM